MSFLEFDPVYLVYGFVAISAILLFEAVYFLCFSGGSYRKNINRRLRLMRADTDRESILIQLRRERGLTGSGNYRLPLIAFNQLVTQSGLKISGSKGVVFAVALAGACFAAVLVLRDSPIEAFGAGLFGLTLLPLMILRMMRGRRQKKFGGQFPDALDIITRSLRAGHPVPVAIAMVAREMRDPIGTEFGIVGDEVAYGADLETAMRNLYQRIGQEDLPLFVTAVAIQTSTGGNLGEILQNLSRVIRDRFKMRRKVKALAAEGRASALILSSLPIGIFFVIYFVSPDFYNSVIDIPMTQYGLGAAASWMMLGNFIMYRLVNFRI